MTVQEALKSALDGRNLTQEEASSVMSQLMLGEVHHGLMGGFLVGMQAKGITGDELAGFAKSMRSFATRFDSEEPMLVDTCGTGGGKATFNLSTGAAILAAAAGAKVAKHGNRAVTSKCGSADVLEELGTPIEGDLASQKKRLEETGFLFLFAPAHHPAVRHVAPVRKALGVRTFFNLLGPLANPANAKRQLIGVFDGANMVPMAEALVQLGIEEAFVVHGTDGMDEISPVAETRYVAVKNGELSEGSWTPGDFGVSGVTESDLAAGESPAEAAAVLRSALDGSHNGRGEALVPNTAVTLVLAGRADTIEEGAALARETLKSAKAIDTLEKLGRLK